MRHARQEITSNLGREAVTQADKKVLKYPAIVQPRGFNGRLFEPKYLYDLLGQTLNTRLGFNNSHHFHSICI